MERIGAGGTSRSDDGGDVEQVERALARRSSGTTARMPSLSHVRVMRVAISPRLAMNSVRIGVGGAASARPLPPPRLPRTRQSRHLRHANVHQRVCAGSRPLAIQRWTERVVAPIRAAAWLGLSSSDIDVAIVA